jgi:hypothetical protein
MRRATTSRFALQHCAGHAVDIKGNHQVEVEMRSKVHFLFSCPLFSPLQHGGVDRDSSEADDGEAAQV